MDASSDGFIKKVDWDLNAFNLNVVVCLIF
jgi:hypothetical protein